MGEYEGGLTSGWPHSKGEAGCGHGWSCTQVEREMGVRACGWERVGVRADGPQKLGSVAVKMRIMYGLTFFHGPVNVVVVVWACGWVWMAREGVVSVMLRAETVRDG